MKENVFKHQNPPSPKQSKESDEFVKRTLEKVINDAMELLKTSDTGTKECENYNNGFIDGIRYVFKNIIG